MNARRFGAAVRSCIAGVACAALLAACSKDEPKSTRWNDAAAAVASAPPVSSVPAIATGTLNKFFPKDGEGGFTRVFAADKEGYAEAKLQKDGKDVGQLSISDAERVPGAKGKFDGATEKLDGFPLLKVGNNQSSVLVKERFQVKVSSPTLDHDARRAILSTFDLKGLNKL
jgi:hypothetical protein